MWIRRQAPGLVERHRDHLPRAAAARSVALGHGAPGAEHRVVVRGCAELRARRPSCPRPANTRSPLAACGSHDDSDGHGRAPGQRGCACIGTMSIDREKHAASCGVACDRHDGGRSAAASANRAGSLSRGRDIAVSTVDLIQQHDSNARGAERYGSAAHIAGVSLRRGSSYPVPSSFASASGPA
jgi:hypothetical protein